MGDGRRKGRQECAAGAWTPPTGSSSLPGRMPGLDPGFPGRMPGLDPGGSLMDDQEHRSGSRTARRGCYDFLCSPLAGFLARVDLGVCVGPRGLVRRRRGSCSADACVLLSPFAAPRPLPGSARLCSGLHSLLRLSLSAPSELLLLFLTSPSFPALPLLFFSLSITAILADLHCGFHLLYLPQRSAAGVLGTCLWPRVVGSESSGRVASENRTGRGGEAKAGAQQRRLFLPKASSPFPRQGCSLKSFPPAQILERAALLTPEGPRPLPLAVPSVTPTMKTHQRRVVETLICLSCLVAKLCLTLCDPRDCSLPGSSVPRISQTRILEWVAILSPEDLPDSGIEPVSSALADGFFFFLNR